MKHLKPFKILESYSKPEPKYPVGYKCLDTISAEKEIKEIFNIELTEIKSPGSRYGTENFYSWCGENLKPIYPKYSSSDHFYEFEKQRYKNHPIKPIKTTYFEKLGVYEIPINYDSTGDDIAWGIKKDNFRKRMTDMLSVVGKKWDTSHEDHIDFGPKSNDWVNTAFKAFYELYSEYYINGKLRIWSSNDYEEYDIGKQIYDYPLDKAIFFSELEKWICDFDIDTNGFYEWILNCQYIEGRYWERSWIYKIEDFNFRKINAPNNVKQINELLRQIYKEKKLNIYLDYYKKVNDEIFY